jgi:hypothetical protein
MGTDLSLGSAVVEGGNFLCFPGAGIRGSGVHPVVRARQCQAHPQILHAGPFTKFALLESQTFKQQGVADLQLLVKARSFSAWSGTPV